MRSSALAGGGLGPGFGGGARLDRLRTLEPIRSASIGIGDRLASELPLGFTGMRPLLSMVWRNSAPHHPNPAEAQWRWRGKGANRSGSASVTTIHAPFTTEVECKMASFTHVTISRSMSPPDPNRCSRCCPHSHLKVPAEMWARAAIGYHAAETRRVSAAGLALTSGQVVT